ncbi:MAG: hypothetical protein P4L42_15435 [Desulfocapsaceae bacterium]|nr:hypothetical protein [Desulfocapsaceae bacterium]
MAENNVIQIILSAIDRGLSSSIDKVVDKLGDVEKASRQTQNATNDLKDAFAGLATKAAQAFAGIKLADLIKDSVTMAARYETLGVVMDTVGRAAGYAKAELKGAAEGLQKTGISMEASRQAVVRMIQANIDLSKSTELARVAQNAAVVANVNSSEAYDRMMTGIATGQVVLLHNLGIMANFEQAYMREAKALGITANQLTENQKAQARMNEALRAGASINGAYESSMTTAGKQLLSMTRYIQDLMVKLGEPFLKQFADAVKAATEKLKEMQDALDTDKGREIFASLRSAADLFFKALKRIGPELITFAGLLGAAKVAQIALNVAVGANPYARAALALGTLNEALRAFDMNIGSLPRKALEFNKSVLNIWDAISGKRDWNTGEIITQAEKDARRIASLRQQIDEINKKPWYSVSLFADPGAKDKRVKDLQDEIKAIQDGVKARDSAARSAARAQADKEAAEKKEAQDRKRQIADERAAAENAERLSEEKKKLRAEEIADYNRYIEQLKAWKAEGKITQGELDELANKKWASLSLGKNSAKEANQAWTDFGNTVRRVEAEIANMEKDRELSGLKNILEYQNQLLAKEQGSIAVHSDKIDLIDKEIARYRQLLAAMPASSKSKDADTQQEQLQKKINDLYVERANIQVQINAAQLKALSEQKLLELEVQKIEAHKLPTLLARARAEQAINDRIAQERINAKQREIDMMNAAGPGVDPANIIGAQAELAQLRMQALQIAADGDTNVIRENLAEAEEKFRSGVIAAKEYQKAVQAALGKVLTEDQVQEKLIASGDDMGAALSHGFREARKTMQTDGEMMIFIGRNIADQISSNLESAWTSFITGSKSAKESMRDFALSTIQWLSQIISKQMIMNALQGMGGKKTDGGGMDLSGVVSKIGSFFSFAAGGAVPGWSPSPTADNIPAWLTAREFVQPVRAVDYYGLGFMEQIRRLQFPKNVAHALAGGTLPRVPQSFRLAQGGQAPGQPPETVVKAGDINLRVINVNDKNMLGDLMRTSSGEQTMLNFIRRNGSAIKTILGG